MWSLVFVFVTASPEAKAFTSPAAASSEYGHALAPDEALAGWIALFDGKTTFGWDGSEVNNGVIAAGKTTSVFGACDLQGDAAAGGELAVGEEVVKIAAGKFRVTVKTSRLAPITLGAGLRLKSLLLKPTGLQTILNGRDLQGWKTVAHPKIPADRQTIWKLEEGSLHARGGPGALEFEKPYGDLVLQMVARMRAPLVNGGLFFRSVPGQFMNGYEAQLFNGCYERDPGQPARYSTGAIDDRQLARRLVSRDNEPFLMTVVAVGPHIATWVNGYQMTDWTDTRPVNENPRSGMRLDAGTIQLQAHDPETDIEFRRVDVMEIK